MFSLLKSYKDISKFFLFLILLITIPNISQSAVYSSADTPIFHTGGTTITSDIVIAASGGLEDLNVTLDITNTYDSDLVITLKAPDGTNITLVNRRGGGGDDFTATVLDDEAGTDISSGSAPFTGSYRPEMPLSLLDGKSITGTWELKIQDLVSFDSGILNSWSMDVTASAAGDSGDGTVYNSADVPILNIAGLITSDIVVADSGYLTDVNVTIDITKLYTSDLVITLKAPDGTSVLLVNSRGGSGDHFTGTTLDDEASVSISTGTAPFAGSYTPEALLSSLDGKSITGTWVLEVFDPIANDLGDLNSWSVELQASDPLADDGTLVTDEDTPGSDTLSATDSGGDSLTYSVVVNAADGNVVIDDASTGDYTYTPDANYNGSDFFTFKAVDSNSDTSNTATISVTVNPTSDDPIATNGSLGFDEDTVGAGALSASDADRDRITYSLVTIASYGVVVVDTTNGTYTYTQDTEHWNGSDYFTFQAMDSYSVYSNIATVDITVNSVNDLPVATGDSKVTDEDVAVSGTASASDPVEGDSITFAIDTDGTDGTATIDSITGIYTYTPDTNWSGSDSFTFVATDSNGGVSNAATINLTVNSTSDDPVTVTDVDGVYDYNWSVTMNGTYVVYSRSVATDSSGNAYVAGEFFGTADFDSSAGTDEFVSSGTEDWTRDIYLTKINADSSYGWTRVIGSDLYDTPSDVAVDLASNVYMVGRFMNTVDFDPTGPGDVHEGAVPGVTSTFITKMSSDGSYGWTKTLTSAEGVGINSVVVDTDYSVYVTGSFEGTVDLDPGAGTDEFTSSGYYDGFVTKLDSDGNLIWTRVFTGTGAASGGNLAVDGSGSVFVSGTFVGTVDFDPSGATDDHTSVVSDKTDVFITKLGTDGSYGWTRSFGGPDSHRSSGLALDSSGNAFIGGHFWGTADFDPGAGVEEYTSAGAYDMYFMRIDSDGTYKWTKVFGGTSSDSLYDVVIDSNDNIFVTGGFWSELDFDPGLGTDFRSTNGEFGYQDAFLSKFGTDGSYRWTKLIGAEWSESGHAMALDNDGNLFLTGVYEGDTDLDPSIEVDAHTNLGAYNGYLSKYSYNVATLTTDEDTSVEGILSASDSDGDSLIYSIVGVASNGTATITDSATGEFTYTPDADYNGSDLFTFQVVDSNSNTSNISSVSITILPVNDAPLAVNDSINFDEDAVGVGSASATDAESDSMEYSVTDGPYFGILTFNTTSGDFSYSQITTDWSGSDYFSFTVTDSNGATSNTATFDLTIDPFNDAPPVTTTDILETYNWTVTMGSTGVDWGHSVAVDASGNVYTTGYFSNTVDFDPGAGTDNQISTGGRDIFLTKMNADGSYGWTKTMGSTGTDWGRSVAVDSNGNVYMVGMFQGAVVDFDPGVGVDEHYTAGNRDLFITKIWNNGSYGWTKTFGGIGFDDVVSVSVDSSGNVFLTGPFSETVDFDPSGEADDHTSAGSEDIFLIKLNSDGVYSWTKTFGGTGADWGFGVAVDESSNIYLTGYFSGTVDFDPSGGDDHTSVGSTNTFLTKILNDGSYGWTKTFSGAPNGTYGMAIDSNSNIFVTGWFRDAVDFDPLGGGDDHTSAGNYDMFLTKINSDGSYGWTKTVGSSNSDEGSSVSVDLSDNVFVTGNFRGTVNFDIDGGTDEHTSGVSGGAFLTRINSDGSYGWTKTLSGSVQISGSDVFVDSSGNVFTTGTFRGTSNFDWGTGTDNRISVSNSNDIFLTKMSSDSTILSVLEDAPKTGTLSATDYDNDPMIYSEVTPPSFGTVTFIDSTIGTFTYTPDPNYFGADSFTFKANDGFADSNISTITVDVISVNDIPTAVGGSLGAINEDTVGGGTVTVSGADVEGDSIIFSLVTDASYGTVVINSTSGDYTYTPDAHWNGSDFFTFQAIDSSGGYSSPATINLTVNSVNDAPVATSESVDTDEDTEYFGTLTGSDPVEGSSVIFLGQTPPTNGSMTGWNGLTGTYSYMPDPNFYGVDSFTFMTTDGMDSSSISTITIVVASVNDDPVAYDATLPAFDEDTVGAGTVTSTDVESDSVTYSLVGVASYGTVVITSTTGDYTFTPDTHWNGSDSFTYQVLDSNGGYSNVATISITVDSINDAPVTTSDVLDMYDWTKTFGGASTDTASGVFTDISGNIFVTGGFQGTADFDSSSGIDEHTSAGLEDIYLTKINSDGTYGWTKTFGGLESDSGSSVAVDLVGNIYITGNFQGTADFNPSGGSDIHVSAGAKDIFIAKINTDGTYGWTKSMGDTTNDKGNSISVDSSGNVFITGEFSGTVDFDYSVGIDNHTSSGGRYFLTKINSDSTYGWTKTPNINSGTATTVGSDGNIFVTGGFSGTVDFDSSAGIDNHTSQGSMDIFLTKINNDGTYGWTKIFGGTSWDYGYGVSTSLDGNVFVTGYFSGTVDFDTGVSIDNHTSAGALDVFLTKINSDATYGWTRTFGGAGTDYGEGVSVGLNGNIYVTGTFVGTVDFDSSVGVDNHTSIGFMDIYLTKINSNGNYGWTKTFGGTSYGYGYGVSSDSVGNVFTTGFFLDTVDFDSSEETDNHISTGSYDVFVTKLGVAGTLSVLEDNVKTGTLSANDIDGDSLIYSIVDIASNGTVTITNSSTGEFTYTPDADYDGSDFFTFKVNDGSVDSNISTITVEVIPVNDQFTLSAPDINTYQNTDGTSQITVTDPDIGDSHTYSVVTITTNGSVIVSAGGLVTYLPDNNNLGGDTFDVEVTDSGGLTDIVTISVTVTAVDSTPPVDGVFNVAPGNSSADLNWNSFTDDLGDISYTVVMETGTAVPSVTCSTGTTVYTGTGSSTTVVLLNGTTYNMRLCGTDSAGNTSNGVTGTATPSAPTDGITFASDDANANGLVRKDGGSDANNLDADTGKPKTDAGFEFKVVVKDTVSGAAPLSVILYVEDRATPGVYTPYDMSCSGDYTEGLLCSYETLLGAFASGSYYFEVVLGDIPGTVVTSATFQMPAVSLLNGYAMVGVARDIDGSSLVAADLGCTDPNSIYRWVSEGLSTVNAGNKGDYALVDDVSPLKAGEGYFLNTATCTPRVAELAAEADINSATYEVTLQTGWNIVSNPYNGNVFLSDIEVQKDADASMTWTNAVSGGLVVNGIYYYNGSDWGSTYTLQSAGGVPDARLAPWVGYWLYLKKDDGVYKLIVPKP